MDPTEYDTLYAVEERHWWYTGMQRITAALLDQLYPGRSDLQILDAGCGTGGMMRFLARYGTVTGIDLSPLALNYTRQRGLARTARASVVALPFPAGSFDLVTTFDVLYHVQVADYQQAINEAWRVLRPGGRLLLRLPAYDWLRGRHDEVVHTGRRFTAGQVRQALLTGHFRVERLSYANTILFPMALAARLAGRIRPPAGNDHHSDVKEQPGRLDPLLARALHLEARWLGSGRALPFGLSVVATGRKEHEEAIKP